ncbi:hypothetical protein A4X03_0g9114 [Tilletia caries]|uniref:Uncharacterized protein n=2 Tax=cellular organisms TaxID=131567 RepID=A0A177SZ05_9BASI|nr:hypothetical protein A4X03_0g9114 [Tilletia caries]
MAAFLGKPGSNSAASELICNRKTCRNLPFLGVSCMFALEDWPMNDDDNFSRRLYDPSHPLYVSSAAEDGLARLTKNRDDMTELGPWGVRLLYAGLAVVAAYFGLILVFGTH